MNSPPKPTPEEPENGFDGRADVGPADVSQDLNAHASIEQLHELLSLQLRRIAWSILRDWQLASDAVQEAFGLLTQRIGEIPPTNRRGWLIKTVQFQALNLRRKQQRFSEIGLGDSLGSETVSRQTLPDVVVERQEDLQRIRLAIDRLPDGQRLVVEKRLGEDQSFAEIAKQMNLPLGTVLSRMRLALQKLKTELS